MAPPLAQWMPNLVWGMRGTQYHEVIGGCWVRESLLPPGLKIPMRFARRKLLYLKMSPILTKSYGISNLMNVRMRSTCVSITDMCWHCEWLAHINSKLLFLAWCVRAWLFFKHRLTMNARGRQTPVKALLKLAVCMKLKYFLTHTDECFAYYPTITSVPPAACWHV